MKKKSVSLKRLLSLVVVLAMVLAMLPMSTFAADGTTLYLKPNSNWMIDNARFAIYYWNNSGNAWVSMTDSDGDGVYEGTIPAGYTNIIFCRMNPNASANNWNNKWNQTADLTVPTNGNNCYTVKAGTWDKGGGTWSVHTPASSGEETEATYYVAGSSGLCGSEWSNNDEANLMTLNGSVYEITYKNVAAGSYEFKVTDGTWDNCWPSSNYVLTLTEESNVTITFDPASHTVTATTSGIVATSYYLAGWINNTDYTGLDYAFVGGTLTTTFPSDSYIYIQDSDGVEYKTAAYCQDTTGTFAKGNPEKMYVPGGVELTFTLVENANGTLTVSYVQNSAIDPDATYYVAGSSGLCGSEWSNNDAANLMTLNGSVYEITYKNVAAGSYEFKVTDGTWDNCWPSANYELTLTEASNVTITFDPSTKNVSVSLSEPSQDDEGDGSTCTVTLHFANTQGWNQVALYSWDASNTTLLGGWPGTLVSQDDSGFYTYEYQVPSGTTVNFIFNNNGGGSQTADLTLGTVSENVEKWIKGEEILDNSFRIVTSPVVSGSDVTFNYADESASSVQVFGSWDGWATGISMSKDSDGVWSYTLSGLSHGTYEYKFVVGGNWVTDPANSWTQNDNSAFVILNPDAVDTNKVTVNIHYTRESGDYDGWNFWIWNDNGNISNTSEVVNGELITTLYFNNARAVQNVSIIPRLSTEDNEWKEQEATYTVDLSNIVSGTVDFYIPSGTRVLNEDVAIGNKLKSVKLDYDNNYIVVTTANKVEDAIFYWLTKDNVMKIVSKSGNTYVLDPGMTLNLATLYQYSVIFEGIYYDIDYTSAYASDRFAAEFTYDGDDLGATWTTGSTTFRVWAPTAESVSVKLYTTGSDIEKNAAYYGSYAMSKDVNGTWVVSIAGNLLNVYYTYEVNRDGETVEAVDPYARATGVNGNRGMIVDLDYTDPSGWSSDSTPNTSYSYTDSVIYELHVRDFSIDESSGVSEANRGKFLAFTEWGTTVNGNGETYTGISYLQELGVTHVHLLPIYDYASVDETTCEKYNWGYDPQNYNVPEGSYSTNPYDGNVRINEMKLMVQSLHEAGINVIMDVVYNHVYDAETFCFNQIVPGYFSRQDSNGSGCGNDTASEREMVRKYIVESICYWADEYHIDGFRFDLVGLLDTTTINQIVEEVHKTHPHVIFYGEGWTLGTNVEAGNTMATQQNSKETPDFAYFSDTIRNLLAGDNSGSTLGFVSGATGKESSIIANFLANAGWSTDPTQIVQYASCHDNYTLADKLILSTGAVGITDDIISMNNLTAAIYLTAQGIPFIHAGEEMLREKLNADGSRNHNSYNSSDYVNSIKWDNLLTEEYADTAAYYAGLIAFRKEHAALRMTTAEQISANIQSAKVAANVVAFLIDGTDAEGYYSDDDIFVIFNANSYAVSVDLPEGVWSVYIDKDDAGIEKLYTAEVSVQVDGISAMVLTRTDYGKNEDETTSGGSGSDTITLYFSNNKYWNDVCAYYWGGTTGSSAWPGNAMTYVETNEYGESIYSITIPADTTYIIFNGSSGQTVNIPVTTGGIGYYCTDQDAEGKYQYDTYPYGEGGGATGGFTNDGTYTGNDYYLFGWIDGADYACGDTYASMGKYCFDKNGQLTVHFEEDSYVGVKTTNNGTWYMTDGWLGNVSSATLYNSEKLGDNANKLMIPGGVDVLLQLTVNGDGTLTLSIADVNYNGDVPYADHTGIQSGVTLHCWNWSFAEIEKNMAKIAEMGFTAIQTSPIQPIKEATTDATDTVSGCWWLYYQPVGFTITDSNDNVLGTKDDLISMIETAHEYGIKVIVDVVANHLANETGNDLSSAISEELRLSDIWHDITKNVTNWGNRYEATQYCVSGLPDLDTSSEIVQNLVLSFLKECIDAGVDGFRFDAAKHIETDSDELAYESSFWSYVTKGAQNYANTTYGKDIYVYGEILDSTDGYAIHDYVKYMSVTDNSWGNTLRENIGSGNAALVPGYDKAANAGNLVIWAESHDTYADGSSADETVSEINKTWALVAARANAMGLYLARPESTDQLLGIGSVTGWYSDVVAAVNQFHTDFAGTAEYLSNESGISYVERDNMGAVLVNVSGYQADITVTSYLLLDGEYCDVLTGNVFTVEDGTISGTIGETGVAVLYNTALIPVSHNVTITETTDGTVTSSHTDAAEGETVTITVTANDGKVVDKVVVTDEAGNAVAVTDNGDGTYSFVQPAGDVTVTVTFADAPVDDDGKTDDDQDDDTTKDDDSSNADTGDVSQIGAVLALMVVSLLAVLVLMDQRLRAMTK